MPIDKDIFLDALSGSVDNDYLTEKLAVIKRLEQIKQSQKDPKSDLIGDIDNNVLPHTRTRRKCVLLITPFIPEKLDVKDKMYRYANVCMGDSFKKNESPVSTQSMYYGLSGSYGTNIERDNSFIAQVSWLDKADYIVVYADYGVTPAMETLINLAFKNSKKVEIREIGKQV